MGLRTCLFFVLLLMVFVQIAEGGNKVNLNADTKVRLEEMLYPTVRMRSGNAGGSGTVIFSGKNAKGEYETYVIGCHHVVEDSIQVKSEWDSMLGREVKREHTATIHVEPFRYIDGSRCVGGAASLEADIVGYDSRHDLALVKLRDKEHPFNYVAHLIPMDDLTDIQVTDDVWACGAGLGHKPVLTKGNMLSIDDEIEDLRFYLSSACSIYGHSGGSIYRYSDARERHEFIGIPARITIMPKGFMGYETVSWMGYGIPIQRIYQFLDKFCYQFIYDPSKSIEDCDKDREAKQAESRKVIQRMYGIVE